MADGGWRMADGGWRMADGGWRIPSNALQCQLSWKFAVKRFDAMVSYLPMLVRAFLQHDFLFICCAWQ